MNNQPGVIVIGGHVQGLGIIRIYGKLGIPCILLDHTPINLARHSRYCHAFYKYPYHDLFSFLMDFKKKEQYKGWLLIPTHDSQVKILSEQKALLEDFYITTIAGWPVIEKCYNKINTYRLAQQQEIAIPKTWFPASVEDLNTLDVDYPCIIKPAVMHSFYSHFKTKVFLCRNRQQLIDNYQRAITIIPPGEVIVQQIIPGDSSNQYSACFLFDGEQALVQMVARRLRQHPPDFGNATTYAETVANEFIINEAARMLKAIGFKGICEVEFKFDTRDNQYKLLEINPRTWKWHYIAQAAASPFLEMLYRISLGETTPEHYLSWKEACWQHRLTDRFIRYRLKKGNPALSPNPCAQKIYAVYDSHDIKPFLFERLYLPYLLFSR